MPKINNDSENSSRLNAVFFAFFMCISLNLTCFANDSELNSNSAREIAENKSFKVFRQGISGSPGNLDPLYGGTIYSSLVTVSIYDTLFRYKYFKRPYELFPSLAASMPKLSRDGLEYTISLKKGVYFQNDACFEKGTRELVAEDVIFTFKRHLKPQNRSRGAWLWKDRIEGVDQWVAAGSDFTKNISGIEAIDRYTVKFKLLKPYPQFLHTLAMSFSSVVPKEAVLKYGKELATHPVGSGPFKLESYNRKQVVLVKNHEYRKNIFYLAEHGYDPLIHLDPRLKLLDGKSTPFLDKIVLNFFTQPASKWQSFNKDNEVQYIILPQFYIGQVLDSLKPLKMKKAIEDRYLAEDVESLSMYYHEFNLKSSALGYDPDPKMNERKRALRCAIKNAYDWRTKNNYRMNSIGYIYDGVIPYGLKEFDDSKLKEAFDPDLAATKKLLQEHGWNAQNLPKIVLGGERHLDQQKEFLLLRQNLTKIGYPKEKIVNKVFSNFSEYYEAVKKGDLDLHTSLIWYLDYPDIQSIFQIFYSKNHTPGANTSGYFNKQFDEIFDSMSANMTAAKRVQLSRKASTLVENDCVLISGFTPKFIHIWHKKIVLVPFHGVMGSNLMYIDTATPM